jgi:hypothetical protein
MITVSSAGGRVNIGGFAEKIKFRERGTDADQPGCPCGPSKSAVSKPCIKEAGLLRLSRFSLFVE